MFKPRGPRGPYKKLPLAVRFQRRIKPDKSGCHIWQGHINHNGYGTLGDGNVIEGYKPRFAHRIAWELKHGPVPDGMFVLHKCDVRACANVEHLFLGTLADNIHDCIAKGRFRHGHLVGEAHGRALMTDKEVLAARRLHANGWTGRQIAEKYGLSLSSTYKMLSGRNWKHLNEKES